MANIQTTSSRRPGVNWWSLLLLVLCLGYLIVVSLSAIRHGRHKDFGEFYLAADAMRHGTDIYSVGKDGYIYPPLLAFLMMPMTFLDISAANVAWLCLNTFLLLFGLAIADRTLRRQLRLSPEHSAPTTAIALAVLLSIDKLHAEFVFGQCDLWTLMAWVLGLAWIRKHPVSAGVVLGLAANIKYLTLITLPYLIWRRQYRAALSLLGAAIGWALVPALWLGWDTNADYWATAGKGLWNMLGQSPQTHAARICEIQNQMSVSITSAAVRATSLEAPTAATFGLIAIIGGILAAVLVRMYHKAGCSFFKGAMIENREMSLGEGLFALEWVGLLVLVLAFSPQTGSRHLSMLVLPCLAGLTVGLSAESGRCRWAALLGVVVLTAGLILPPDSDHWMASVRVWHSAGGPTWCAVVMYLMVLWAGFQLLPARASRPEAGAR